MSTVVDLFGQWVAQERQARGWTQAGLAAESGVNQKTISTCERAICEPGLSSAVRLAAALDLDLNALKESTS